MYCFIPTTWRSACSQPVNGKERVRGDERDESPPPLPSTDICRTFSTRKAGLLGGDMRSPELVEAETKLNVLLCLWGGKNFYFGAKTLA